MSKEAAKLKRRTKRGSRPAPGDLFAINLTEGSWGLGHIMAADSGDICCVLFAVRAASAEELHNTLDRAMATPIGFVVTMDGHIRDGLWPVVGNRTTDYPGLRPLPMHVDEGAVTYGVGNVQAFIEAYLGLRPWDEWVGSAACNQAILLPHLPIPPTARFIRGAGAPPPAAPAPKPAQVTDGPALVTVQIVYPGAGLPSADLVRRRQEMERRLEAEGAGEIDGAESGAGVMEVYLRTQDVRRAVQLVEQVGAELGLADDILIETAPLEEEEEDDP